MDVDKSTTAVFDTNPLTLTWWPLFLVLLPSALAALWICSRKAAAAMD